MGTNYYVKKEDNSIHIGKSSFGWKFLFQENNEYYDKKDKSSIFRFLKLNKTTFINEYNEKVDVEEFWKMVEQKQQSGTTIHEYYGYPESLKCYDENGLIVYPPPIKIDDEVYKRLPPRKDVLECIVFSEEITEEGLVFSSSDFS